ncbi:MAG TPA: polyprenyl synthetase family protein [Candidatus Enterocloster excrementipullorum]|uniref:Farnesyl diphosphate synthase n=1 Tax=Candidatus Enterocloster excrementipullorum TaxID=2838559 RepID=A0A9D2SHI0_9FIRM|nr:polyprenyl synthetase family protein [Candidatus Enterocloster excrementipullorum]
MSDRETFKKELDERTKEVNALIEGYLPEEAGAQKTIFEAMNYSMRAGGKRLRPLFMQEMCRLFTGEVLDTVKPFMAAVEMIHTSSLVHDDLPCMDDDMMRRGKASTWAEYGEDIGVLTGDALMIYAMETASKAFAAAQDGEELARVGQAMEILARKTGPFGMIGGQTVDVELAGGPIPKDKLDFIYRLKTGALIEASMLIGAVLGGAADQDCRIVESLASKLGMAFQIQDDILDVEGSEASMGKPAGSDEKNQKTTYVTLEGMDKAKKEVERLSREAAEDLDKLGSNEFLEGLIRFLVNREK